ncbi:hypothetical protein ACSCBZ_46520 [Streptomyces niveiscabiei]|uniref:hypothetical protein n=1 Tax=Streptomyces niveiscabiei TaxID=164115 RepID=UPI00142DC966|nr:hypothetical protein [Streptomyces niveiscabiei]
MTRTRLERIRASVGIAQLALQQIEDELNADDADDIDQEDLAAVLDELVSDTDLRGGLIPALAQVVDAAQRRAVQIEPDQDGEASCPLSEASELLTDNVAQLLIWAAHALEPQAGVP